MTKTDSHVKIISFNDSGVTVNFSFISELLCGISIDAIDHDAKRVHYLIENPIVIEVLCKSVIELTKVNQGE